MVHNTGSSWVTQVQDGDHWFVIAPELDRLPRKTTKPENTCYNYGEQFLPFNAYAPVLSCIWRGHLPLNHFPLKYPPKPMPPTASVYKHMSGDWVTVESRKKECPFHPTRKALHIIIKVLEKFLVVWWKQLGTPLVRSIQCRRKVLHGTTALQANCRVAITDRSSIKHTHGDP